MVYQPLASRLRPTTLDEFIGQSHLISDTSILRKMIESDMVRSIILFGPPGTGKTTLAQIITAKTDSEFQLLNGSVDGAKNVKDIICRARKHKDINQKTTVLCVDEIHRQAKNVQDIYLPAIEDGVIILIGMTTQNPYFALIPALVSRSQLFEFQFLTDKDLLVALVRGVEYYKTQDIEVNIDSESALHLTQKSGGDARKLLNSLEILVETCKQSQVNISLQMCKEILPRRSVVFDSSGDDHFDIMSGIQGAIQASDVHGAIFWLSRAINSGEDIQVICRRLLVTASEDVGTCNPMAAVHTYCAVKSALMVGFPEASLILSSAVAYLAMCPRSKASAKAIWKALKIDDVSNIPIPDFLKDCHYKGAERLGHGSYHDGENMDEYKIYIKDIFKPENGDEIELFKNCLGE